MDICEWHPPSLSILEDFGHFRKGQHGSDDSVTPVGEVSRFILARDEIFEHCALVK